MAAGTHVYRVAVLAGGDPLREERLTRSLRDDLTRVEGTSVDFTSGSSSGLPGSKGGNLTNVALLVAALAASKPLANVLVTAIREWCQRDRHRKVRVTCGEATLEITGKPDPSQHQLVREFLEKVENAE
ncbi:hypothetical protein C1701_25215 [Actinoalloteichus sp. AHMU CJ021]|uniref:effector-associated constant component EACC1 n=1 Tax=Actinoalloteichus TaxID=65496 RepID=UPI00038129BA|nr:hypothetical protein [Actinoalloteichus spitiensis]AUS81091.1 hypothetical protein C1701_25215 [Actinoalloteichus sp. AHMU CJ021]